MCYDELCLCLPEQLHTCVMNVWENTTHRYAMGRAFAAHPQIVCAILEHDGSNDFLSKKNGMSFGVRKCFHKTEEGDGVVLTEIAPDSEGETAAGIFVNERQARGLKYPVPDVSTFENANITRSMVEILMSYMEEDKMTEDIRDYWMRYLVLEEFED